MYGKLMANGYTAVDSPEGADVILVNTCAIRENAETRVIGRGPSCAVVPLLIQTLEPLMSTHSSLSTFVTRRWVVAAAAIAVAALSAHFVPRPAVAQPQVVTRELPDFTELVERDYPNLYKRFTALGPLLGLNGGPRFADLEG